MNAKQLYDFLSDGQLDQLIEQVKTSDDIFDVIDLRENQHSDMLAWCLTPNEGHAQGDAVIKDFLIAAYSATIAMATFDNRHFFSRWNPGRIRTSSFGAAFLSREFPVNLPKGDRNFLDLFLVDTENRIIVTIEIKKGADLKRAQLERYREAVKRQIGKRPAFKGYDLAFVVLDEDLETYSDKKLQGFGTQWALLDFKWLERSANRAREQVERHNGAAQLLMAYCQRQTDWTSDSEIQASNIAADICFRHEAAINAMVEIQGRRISEWTPKSLNGTDGELLKFYNQNRAVCAKLLQTRGIGAVRTGLRNAPEVDWPNIQTGRTWINCTCPQVVSLMRSSDDALWPIYVNVYRNHKASEQSSAFDVRLGWDDEAFSLPAQAIASMRQLCSTRYPPLKNYAHKRERLIMLKQGLDTKKAVSFTLEVLRDLGDLIGDARKKGLL